MTNILSLPLRKTSNLASLSQAIRDVLALQYDENPELYTQDIQKVQEVREKIASLEPGHDLLQALLGYWQQLRLIGQKFPPDIGIDFPWTSAFGSQTAREDHFKVSDLGYEKLNILHNISSVYSYLAVTENRLTDEGLKRACAHFQHAAGCISLLIDYVPDIKFRLPPDLSIGSLQIIKTLLLAQAQEMFWQRAAKDRMKDSTIAKLAAKTSEFYEIAHDYASSPSNAGLLPTSWLSHLLMKQYHFAGAAQYRKSVEALGANKYGEEVARLQAAQQYTEKAKRLVKTVNPQVASDFQSLSTVVSQAIIRAERDNHLIYLDPVPHVGNLTPIPKTEMVKCVILQEIIKPSQVEVVFANLVPYPVHAAIALYNDRKENFRDVLDRKQQEMNKAIQDKLYDLNLPAALDAVAKPVGLPSSVHARGDEIRRAGGSKHLYRQMEDITKVSLSNRRLLDDCFDLLDSSDVGHTDSIIDGLNARASQYQKSIEIAAQNDAQLRQETDQARISIDQLASDKDQLAKLIPLRLSQGSIDDSSTMRLREMIKRLESTKWESQGIIQAANTALSQDTASFPIRQEAASLIQDHPEMSLETAQFETIIEKSLSELDIYNTRLNRLRDRQQTMMDELEKVHLVFMQQRTNDESVQARESFLRMLDTAYMTWDRISTHLAEGLKFYNRLAQVLSVLLRECQEYARSQVPDSDASDSNLARRTNKLMLKDNNNQNTTPKLVPTMRPGEWKGGAVQFG